MSDRLGAWKNAPLAYVLAEVRTEQLADLKNFQPDLAAAFRSQFPIQRALVTACVVSAVGGAPTIEPDPDGAAWEFASPDNRVALVLRPHGFVLHATRYQDHKDFLGSFHGALKVIAGRVPSVFMSRLGLRYVDFIIPKKGEQPEDYVDKRLNPMLDLGQTSAMPTAMTFTIYPMKDGRLTLRYIRGAGHPELPAEFSTIALDKSALMKGQDDVLATQPTAILDMDRIRDFAERRLLEPDFVRRELQGMRDDISEAFKERIITKHARKAWGAV